VGSRPAEGQGALAQRIYEARVKQCGTAYPVAGRAERLAALEAELDLLRRSECALVDADEDTVRDPRSPPEPTLGVRLI
jgi:hypothetical protein